MLVIDTSALMAVILDEPKAPQIRDIIANTRDIGVSAGTLVECFVVARRRDLVEQMRTLIDDMDFTVLSVDEAAARRIDAAYARCGGGPARLNFGDMFAYDAAMTVAAPLLFVGDDFASNDVRPALA